MLDAAKGFAAASFPVWASRLGVAFDSPDSLCYVGLVAAIVGHSFSIFIGFKGGKGVAVTIGGLLWIMWAAILIALAIWVAVFYSSRYVSLASISMAASLPVSSVFLYGYNTIHFYIALGIAVLIIVRHHSNISRLIKGTENRF